jgi:Ca-activated chloride channel family protein
VVTAVALLAGAALTARQAAFRTGVQTVAVYASVRDREGRLVPSLDRTAFEVRDNGQVVPLTVFSNEVQPITVALMLDMSRSMQSKFLQIRKSSVSFVENLGPGDRARVGTFGDEVAASPLLTGDKRILRRVIEEEVWPGGGTPLWKAIDVAMTSLAGEPGRRIVLVITDGGDSGYAGALGGSPSALGRRATDESFMVYAIGMEGTGLSGDVVGLAEQSGGGHFQLKDDADLQDTFARVIDELRHQYLIGFEPAALDGKVHRLDVRTTVDGLKVRTRKNYRAAPPQ